MGTKRAGKGFGGPAAHFTAPLDGDQVLADAHLAVASSTASGTPAGAASSATPITPSGDPAATVPALIEALVAADRLVNSMMAMRTEIIEAIRVASLLPGDDGDLDTSWKDVAPTEDQLAARAAMITEMSCALRVPEGTMDTLVDQAQALLTHLPATADAMREGSISYRHVQVMIDQLHGLDTPARARLEDRLLPKAKSFTVTRFKNAARRERERLEPVPVAVRHDRAATGRRVYLEHADDGVSWIHALLPSTVATAAFNRISAVAASLKHPDDGRTLPQLRADIVGALLIDDDAREALRTFHDAAAGHDGVHDGADGSVDSDVHGGGVRSSVETGVHGGVHTGGAAHPAAGATRPACGCFPDSESTGPPDAGKTAGGDGAEAERRREHLRQTLRRIRATVAVTVPVLTLLGGDLPGELEGYGPIDPDTARELCAGAPSFMRLLTHPHTGVVMGIDRDRYSPPADLRAALRLRDQTCRFPGCPRAAQLCDLDHVNDWATGGSTDQSNLIHLCRRHHRLRHTTGWEAEVITHLRHTVGRPAPETPASAGTAGMAGTTAKPPAPEDPVRSRGSTEPLGASVRWTSPTGRTYVTHDAHHDLDTRDDLRDADPAPDLVAEPSTEPNWVWHQDNVWNPDSVWHQASVWHQDNAGHRDNAMDPEPRQHTSCGDHDFVPAHVLSRTPRVGPGADAVENQRCPFPDVPPF